MLIYLQVIDPQYPPAGVAGFSIFSTHSYGYASRKMLRLVNQAHITNFNTCS